MDVLQIIKADHSSIREKFALLQASKSVKERRELIEGLVEAMRMHLYLEEAYLYPELSGLVAEAEAYVGLSKANHSILMRNIEKAAKLISQPIGKQNGVDKILQSAGEKIEQHFSVEEEVLMPYLRKYLPTQDREDLGLVLQDVKMEGVLPIAKTPASRKRA